VNHNPKVQVATANLRDLGGPTTVDGQSVRSGLLFRSGHLADLGAGNLTVVDGLGLRTVIDLRRPTEMEARPTPDLPGVEVMSISVSTDDNEFAVAANAMLDPVAEQHGVDEVAAYFLRFANDRFDRYRPVFQAVTDPDRYPALFHCTAGKDRTGIVAAVLLRLLGVADDDVMADYLLSNDIRRPWIEAVEVDHRRRIAQHLEVDESEVPAARLATSRALLWCHPDYLDALFTGIEDRWGSFDVFVRDGLGLDGRRVEAFRTALLA